MGFNLVLSKGKMIKKLRNTALSIQPDLDKSRGGKYKLGVQYESRVECTLCVSSWGIEGPSTIR